MSRLVTLATSSILVDEQSVDVNAQIERAIAALNEAARFKPDLMVFPEEINLLGLSPEDARAAQEPIPGGPILERFGQAAREHRCNLVVGLRERDGEIVYNAGVVLDRDGGFVGKYRKTHLAPGESAEVVQGDDYPVFELDFGTVGVMICMDLHYPEPWGILALKGADVIAHPTMWMDYTGDLCESVLNTRAIDNQVYVITSHYISMPFLAGNAMGHSRIVDPAGRTRASTGHRPGIAVAEVDLDQGFEYWATGDLKKQYPTLKETFLGMRRPDTYGVITRPDSENNWKIEDPTIFRPE